MTTVQEAITQALKELGEETPFRFYHLTVTAAGENYQVSRLIVGDKETGQAKLLEGGEYSELEDLDEEEYADHAHYLLYGEEE